MSVWVRRGPPAGPVLREGRCQQRIQLCAGIIPKQLVGHVALRLGLSVVLLALVIAEFMAAVVLSLASLASRALAWDLELQGVQCRLLGLRSQACRQTGAEGSNAGLVAGNLSSGSCEVGGESVD